MISAAVSAVINVFDKTIIYRYVNTAQTLPLLIGFCQTTVWFFVLLFMGMPILNPSFGILAAVASGILFGLSGVLLMRVLYTQEVSRTIAVTQSAPIFTAIIARVVLNETISFLQWLSIMAIVLGAALISLRVKKGSTSIFLDSSFYLLMVSSCLVGAAHVVGKISLDYLPVITTHAIRMFILGIVFLLFNLRYEPWIDIKKRFVIRRKAMFLLGINELIIANVGLILLYMALSNGPASLVTALVGSKALFLLLYTTGISLVWGSVLGERVTRGTTFVKLISTLMIVGGVVGISL